MEDAKSRSEAARQLEEMPAETFEAMMRAAQAKSSEEEKMSKEEMERFVKASKDPEWRKMFAEYAEEISDPKYRSEQSDYIRQLEAKGELPPGKKVLYPLAGFVVKTRKSVAVANEGSKVFVNIVQSEKIGEPVSTKTEGGTTWTLPHVLSPPRLERDKKGETATTFDCCFHPSAVARSVLQKPFRDMMTQTAFETVEKSYASHGTSDKLLREYHVLKGVDYKTGQPQPILLSADQNDKNLQQGDDEQQPEAAVQAKKKTRRRAGKKKRKDTGGAASNDEKDDSNVVEAKEEDAFAAALRGKLGGKQKEAELVIDDAAGPRGGRLPVYTITERGYFDLADHVGKDVAQRRPKELVVAFELPDVDSAANVELECQIRQLTLTAKRADGSVANSIDASLPFEVDTEGGRAKFVAKTRVLSVALPLVPPPNALILKTALPEAAQPDDQDGADVSEPQAAEPAQSRLDSNSHARWLDRTQPKPRREFAKDSISSLPEPQEPPLRHDHNGDDDVDDESWSADFVERAQFEGSRPGYVYKTGDKGLGYYPDLIPVEWRQQPASVTLIVKLEAVRSVDLAFPSDHAIRITCRLAKRDASFLATFAGPIDQELCRADAADINVAVVVRKMCHEIWQQPVYFEGALDVCANPIAKPQREKKSRCKRPEPPEAHTDPTPVAPTAFKNTLIFEID